MRVILVLTVFSGLLLSCDRDRVYEINSDFNSRHWPVSEQPEFEFQIDDSLQVYNVYCNVRNSLDYPYANIFLTYYLNDSTDRQLAKDLVRHTLFDEKTGEPLGETGLGDIYNHRIPLLRNHKFPYSGKYKVVFEHYMRTDTLNGVLSVGLRVEHATTTEEN